MEKKAQVIMKSILGIILILLLITLIFLIINVNSTTKITSSETQTFVPEQKTVYIDSVCPIQTTPTTQTKNNPCNPNYLKVYKTPVKKTYCEWVNIPYKVKPQKKYLEYDSKAELEIATGFFGNKIKKYHIQLKNKDYVGGYFTVEYNFLDYDQKIITKQIRKYIPPREEKRFTYADVTPKDYKFCDWNYKIIPETSASPKTITRYKREKKCYTK